jgi:signal peptidase I
MMRFSLRKVIAVCAALAAALTAWFLLAPQALGGSVEYLVVSGTSMKPGLTAGDLVVVRSADRYVTGDVVAYQSPVADRTFVHRILRAEHGRFVLKGDANPYPDAGRPGARAIDGKLWFALPRVGSALGWLGVPMHAAVVGGLLVLILSGGGGAAVERRRRRRRAIFPAEAPQATPASLEKQSGPIFAGRWATYALFGLGFAAVVVAALGLFAFSRGTTTELRRTVPYRESGTFTYWADVRPGVVYSDGRVDTGEPVFLRLVDKLQARFEYRLQTDAVLNAGGRIVLAAVVSDADGWQRTIDLGPAAQFQGNSGAASGTLDLHQVQKLIAGVEHATGVAHESYTVTLAPSVDLGGRLAGVDISDRFTPTLQFRLDRLTLTLDHNTPDRLAPVRTRSAQAHVLRPGAFSALGAEIRVAALRRITVAGGSVLLALLLVVALLRAKALRGGEPFRIEARYGHVLVPVSPSASEALAPLVDVATMEGLARLAEPGNRPILHSERLGAHSYFVEDGGVVYRYSTGGAQRTDSVHEDEEAAARLRLLKRQG